MQDQPPHEEAQSQAPQNNPVDSPAAPVAPATPDQQPKRKLPLYSTAAIGATLFAFVCGFAIFILHVQSRIPSSDWREHGESTPWETDAFTIDELETEWCSSESNERMKLRVACYPQATITLEDVKQGGTLMVSFHNESDQRIGDIVSLPFGRSGFTPIQDLNIKTEGMKATFYPLGGMKTVEEYLIHQASEHLPLWSVKVQYKLDGKPEIQQLYSKTIAPNKLQTSSN